MPSNSDQAERVLWEGEGAISSRNLPSYDLANNRAQSKAGISSVACEEGSQVTGVYSDEGEKRPQADKPQFLKRFRLRQKTTEQSTGLKSPQEFKKKARDTSRDDVDGTHLLVKQKAQLYTAEDLGAEDDETVDKSVLRAMDYAEFERKVSDLTMLTQDKYMKRDFDVGDPIINQFRQEARGVPLEEDDDEELYNVDVKPSVTSEHAEIIFQPKSPDSVDMPPPPPYETSSPAFGFYQTKATRQYGTTATKDEHFYNAHDKDTAKKLSPVTEQQMTRKAISQLPNIYTDKNSEVPIAATLYPEYSATDTVLHVATRENWVEPRDEVSPLTPASMIENYQTSMSSSPGVGNVSVPDSIEQKNFHKVEVSPPTSEAFEGSGMNEKVGNRTFQSCVGKNIDKPPGINSNKRSVTFNDAPYDLETNTKPSASNLGSGKIKERVSCMKQKSSRSSTSNIMDRGTQNVGNKVEYDDERQDKYSPATAKKEPQNVTTIPYNDDEDSSPSPYALYLRAVSCDIRKDYRSFNYKPLTKSL